MKIYFSGAISGGRSRQPLYQKIVSYLKALDAGVLTEHVAHAQVLRCESNLSAPEIFKRDMRLIALCDGLIAEVSTPSLGVGYEIATALQQGKPVLCLCEEGVFLTRMLTGNTDPYLIIKFYKNETEWQNFLAGFVQQLRHKAWPLTFSRMKTKPQGRQNHG